MFSRVLTPSVQLGQQTARTPCSALTNNRENADQYLFKNRHLQLTWLYWQKRIRQWTGWNTIASGRARIELLFFGAGLYSMTHTTSQSMPEPLPSRTACETVKSVSTNVTWSWMWVNSESQECRSACRSWITLDHTDAPFVFLAHARLAACLKIPTAPHVAFLHYSF